MHSMLHTPHILLIIMKFRLKFKTFAASHCRVCDDFFLQNTMCVFLPHNTNSMIVYQCSSIGSAWTVVQWCTKGY